MSPALAASVAVLVALAIPILAQRRHPLRSALIAVLTVGAIAALGAPRLEGARGFLLEPVRTWGVHAVLLALGAAGILGTIRGRRWGLVVAGVVLALLAGHATIALGGLLVADIALAVVALERSPRTLHAGIGLRGSVLALFASDALLAAAFLGHGASEPIALDAILLVTVAIGVRAASLLGIDDEEPSIAPLLVAVPLLLPLAWLPADELHVASLLVAVVAAVAGMRAARAGHRAGFASAATLVALGCASAASSPATLLAVPGLLALAVAAALLPDVLRGGAMLVIAGIGGAGASIAANASAVLLGAGTAPLRIAGVALLVALGGMLVAAMGIVRAQPSRERDPRWVLPVGIVLTGLLAAAVAVPERLREVVEPAIRAARLPDPLAGSATLVDGWLAPATGAALLGWLLLEVTRRRAASYPEATAEPIAIRAVEDEAAEGWVRAAIAIGAVAAAAMLLVTARSFADGWL